jgi:hypothetical protein
MAVKKKTPAAPAAKPARRPAAAKSAPAFPKRELNKWLKTHQSWGHDEWLQLLEDLKAKGHGQLVGDQAGQDSVGLYLETNRSK